MKNGIDPQELYRILAEKIADGGASFALRCRSTRQTQRRCCMIEQAREIAADSVMRES